MGWNGVVGPNGCGEGSNLLEAAALGDGRNPPSGPMRGGGMLRS